ncbi:MAG TPA: PAS domain-containing sensor histidine kinase [Rhizomicrobium sp.]|nr:PAS domain-containing sensor histidine kinase [Rhizomicrobium sp.]
MALDMAWETHANAEPQGKPTRRVLPAWLALAVGIGFGAAIASAESAEIGAGLLIVAALGVAVIVLRRTVTLDSRVTAAERTHRAFFDHAIEGIFRTTHDGRYLDANPALARIYGYENPAALIAGLTNIAGQLYIDPKRRGEFQSLMQDHDAVTDFVSQIRRRDGAVIWISENARAVRDWQGRLVFYEGTVEDVTARMQADEDLRHALSQAEEASRTKTAFLAAMSHELKTPLNSVLGFSEILKTEMLGPIGKPAYREYAENIHNSGKRLLAVINNILDVTRLQAGAITLDARVLVVSELAEEAIAQARAECGDAREVTLDIPALPPIDADWMRLKQALTNLLSNAFKFTPAGGAIFVRARMLDGGGLSIAIEDEGIGMEQDQIEAALEPFHQLDRSLSRRFEGTGLGLSIAKSLVELHGGALAIQSATGEGTIVTVSLPPARVLAKSAAA